MGMATQSVNTAARMGHTHFCSSEDFQALVLSSQGVGPED